MPIAPENADNCAGTGRGFPNVMRDIFGGDQRLSRNLGRLIKVVGSLAQRMRLRAQLVNVSDWLNSEAA